MRSARLALLLAITGTGSSQTTPTAICVRNENGEKYSVSCDAFTTKEKCEELAPSYNGDFCVWSGVVDASGSDIDPIQPDDATNGPSECYFRNCIGVDCCCSYCANPCTQFGDPREAQAECNACSPPEVGGTAQCYPGATGYPAEESTDPGGTEGVLSDTVTDDSGLLVGGALIAVIVVPILAVLICGGILLGVCIWCCCCKDKKKPPAADSGVEIKTSI